MSSRRSLYILIRGNTIESIIYIYINNYLTVYVHTLIQICLYKYIYVYIDTYTFENNEKL